MASSSFKSIGQALNDKTFYPHWLKELNHQIVRTANNGFEGDVEEYHRTHPRAKESTIFAKDVTSELEQLHSIDIVQITYDKAVNLGSRMGQLLNVKCANCRHLKTDAQHEFDASMHHTIVRASAKCGLGGRSVICPDGVGEYIANLPKIAPEVWVSPVYDTDISVELNKLEENFGLF